ncbi:MAG TPA: penicillin-binding transpeptidase domain-containing protein, partial [Baekduia sp.]|nr:penicillin-binding transpeptidase domain-containing protein [Baekduia sp.]
MPPRESPISPQVILRVAYIGVAAVIILGIIFFRLWYLQVLASDDNLAQARTNRLREELIPAPRGEILDRDRNEIVKNRLSTIVVLSPTSLTRDYRSAISKWGVAEDKRLQLNEANKSKRPRPPRILQAPLPPVPPKTAAIEQKLATVLGMKASAINRRVVESIIQIPYGDVQIKTDVPDYERDYILERQAEFPAVSVQQRYLRDYPDKSLAAQIVGTVGEISPTQLKYKHFEGLKPGARVGQEGLEYTYDNFLRGTDGKSRVEVSAFGDRKGVSSTVEPKVGRSLRTTLSVKLQRAGESAIKHIGGGKPGAFVAMNPTNGEIYAMGSYPTYDPRILTKPISIERYRRIFSKKAGAPRFNRAIGGVYPTASTFKPITALAGLATHVIDASTIVDDPGCIQLGEGKANRRCNAGSKPHGPVNVSTALQVSSNVFFFDLGANKLNSLPGQPLQKWARDLGYGKRTGVDLPAESEGIVPDAAWRDRVNDKELACRREEHRKSCGYGDGEGRPWSPGDEANLATGQGDLNASPIQVAVSYAALANGGTVVRPHLGLDVLNEQGELEQRITSG